MITSFLLVVALSLDSFLASLAYGAQKIRIPLRSTLLIALIPPSVSRHQKSTNHF